MNLNVIIESNLDCTWFIIERVQVTLEIITNDEFVIWIFKNDNLSHSLADLLFIITACLYELYDYKYQLVYMN